MEGRIVAVNRVDKRGVPKTNVRAGCLREGWGLVGDAHAGDWDRQVSVFPLEAMALVPCTKRESVLGGGYTENITIEGISLDQLVIGKKLRLGEAEIMICCVGKEKHEEEGRPYIVSREGRFGRVTKSGSVRVGDPVTIIEE